MSDGAHAGMEFPTLKVSYAQTGASASTNSLGMRPMQERAYVMRGEQFLLIKSPPASGKSRALMFIALDKVWVQGLRKALILVPERSIGASFQSTPLREHGFEWDWEVLPRWNLCDSPGTDGSKVKAVEEFLRGDASFLVCTHATFRFAFEQLGVSAFDDCLLAVDEFHHVSANPDNKLGAQLHELIERARVHIVAMTGSYFRGDAEAVLHPDDESRFETVTYTYYEQLNGYRYLKDLDIGYYFYSGSYADDISKVLNPKEKTIVHIPSVNSRESSKDKHREVEDIMTALGEWEGADPETGFQLVRQASGELLRVADLVDDEPSKRDKVMSSLRSESLRADRDFVDIIIALGMAKEGFDWIWCEHALTVGYRASLTEIVQIIGRTTRDAPGKKRARFTNLIAEPAAAEQLVTEAVNDTLKAIAASLLMEQVLAPKFEFRPKLEGNTPTPGVGYGPAGYQEDACNIGVDEQRGVVQVEVVGLAEPKSAEAKRICKEDITEVISKITQDTDTLRRGVFDRDLMPQEVTQVKIAKVVRAAYPSLDDDDQEAVRQHVVAAMNLTQQANIAAAEVLGVTNPAIAKELSGALPMEERQNNAFVEGVRRYALNVRELNIELIDAVNPFGEAYSILSKTMNETRLRQIETLIGKSRSSISPDEALELAKKAIVFKNRWGRLPVKGAADAWENRLAEGATAFRAYKKEGRYGDG